jgi:hypothetical protein
MELWLDNLEAIGSGSFFEDVCVLFPQNLLNLPHKPGPELVEVRRIAVIHPILRKAQAFFQNRLASINLMERRSLSCHTSSVGL